MRIKFEKLKNEDFYPDVNKNVIVTYTGNITKIQYMTRTNHKQTIKKLKNNRYVVCSTGEIKESTKICNRRQDLISLRRTFSRCRDLINTNVTDVRKVRWCTLTYAENMTDTKRLYKDFDKFNKRLKYYLKKIGYDDYKYICMCEPQGRGAWHIHLLLIFDLIAPYIKNEDFAKLWKQGFVKIGKLDNVDNVGAYLTAYLTDMEFNDCNKVDYNSIIVEKADKKIVKGSRLYMYPAKFNMIRYSRNCKQPVRKCEIYKYAVKKASVGTLTFEKTVKLSDNSAVTGKEFTTIINTKYYNNIRKV